LDYNTNEVAVEKYFSQFGEIVDILINKDMKTGKRKGFGFVIFAHEKSAHYLINHNSRHKIDSRVVICKSCIGKEKRITVEVQKKQKWGTVSPVSNKYLKHQYRSYSSEENISNKSQYNNSLSQSSIILKVLRVSHDVELNHNPSNIHMNKGY